MTVQPDYAAPLKLPPPTTQAEWEAAIDAACRPLTDEITRLNQIIEAAGDELHDRLEIEFIANGRLSNQIHQLTAALDTIANLIGHPTDDMPLAGLLQTISRIAHTRSAD